MTFSVRMVSSSAGDHLLEQASLKRANVGDGNLVEVAFVAA